MKRFGFETAFNLKQVILAKLMRRVTALAVFVRRLTRSIYSHVSAIYCQNVRHSRKLKEQKNIKTPYFEGSGHSGS